MHRSIPIISLVALLAITNAVSAADHQRVLCFGDSITEGGKWVALIGADEATETINAGKGGRKAAQAKAELTDYLAQYAELDKIILFLGVNDLPARDRRPGDVKVAGCVESMSEAIDLALTRFKPQDIILVAPCTVNPATMNSTNLKKGYAVTPPLLAQLESGYKALAKEKGVLFLSLLKVVSEGNYKDGLHPNEAGDVEIANAISGFFIKKSLVQKGWPEEVNPIQYSASIDDSQQPMLMYAAESQEKRPLLVGLHTWSGTYAQAGGEVVYARWCIEKDWNFIHPHFRGPNWTPEGCGSEEAVQDIKDAVEYMKTHYNVDTDRIYLTGVSGGGYAALLMAGRAPEIWGGVSAWASISDIRAWWEQTQMGRHSKYATHIEKAVGGRPDQDKKAARECFKRSPTTYLDQANGVNLDINAGVTDGHRGGSVPFTHSLYAFNQVVPQKNRIPADFIETFYEKQNLPAGFQKADTDPLYGEKRVVFRRVSKNTRVTIFQGRHEIIHKAALNWLSRQCKGRPAVWDVVASDHLETTEDESQSGK